MVSNTMVDLDQVIASSPVVILWGEPMEHRPVDFVTSNVSQFGYTVPEIVLEEVPYRSIVFEEDWDQACSSFQEALQAGCDSFRVEYRLVARSGEIRWVEDRVVFHRDGTGRVVLYQSSLLDVTERKKYEIRLLESEQRLSRVLAAAKVSVWEYMPETDEMIGRGREPLLGMRDDEAPRSRKELWDRILPPSSRRMLEKVWSDIKEGRTDQLDLEYEIVKSDGSEAWILTKGFSLRDKDGKLLCIQGAAVDITPLKLAEEKIVRQNDRLALLHKMSLSFMEELDTEVLVKGILEKAVELAGSVNGLIAVVEEDGEHLRHMWGVGLYEQVIGERIPLSSGLFGEVLKRKKRIIVEDYRVFSKRIPMDAYRDCTTVLGIPLHRGENPLGGIAIAFTDAVRVLEEPLLILLDQFAAAASIALENARLYENTRREVEERKKTEERLRFHQRLVEAAAEGANYLLSLESEEKAMSLALRVLGEAAGADRISLFRNRTDPEYGLVADMWAKVAILGNDDLFTLPERVLWENEYYSIFESLSNGMPFYGAIPSARAEEKISPLFDPLVTIMMIPVFIRSRFWGVLAFCSRSEDSLFETDEIDVLRAAAYNIAASVIRWESEREVKQGYEELRKTFSDVIRTMGQIVGKKDPYTIEHQERVAHLALKIGARMGLDKERCEGLRIAGLVHDIGKIEIPGEILSKPGRLSPIEFELIKTHARSGYDILREVDFPWPVAEIAHQHHERMDGSGYPQGLKGEGILLEARIIAVADVVESMMSHRPYRPSLGMRAAWEEIEAQRGVLYDPETVDACLAILDEHPDIISEL